MNTNYTTESTQKLLQDYLERAYKEYVDAWNNHAYYFSESRQLVCENLGLHDDKDGYELLVLNGLWYGKYTFDKGEWIPDHEDVPDHLPNDWIVKTREEVGEQDHWNVESKKDKPLAFDEWKPMHLASLLPDNWFDIGF